MLTFFHSLVEAQVLAAYHQQISRLPGATPRLARLLSERYVALFSFEQQTILEQHKQGCPEIVVASQRALLERLKQGAMLWSFWVLGTVWGWSWIIIGLAAGYGLRYTSLGQQLALAARLLGITTFQPTQAMMEQLTRGFWVVVGLTTVYWAVGFAALCVGIVASVAILETPEGKTFLNWATSFLQYVWDRVSGVWAETLLNTAALEYEFKSESQYLKNSSDLGSQLSLLTNCAALQKKYQEYQAHYVELRPALWNLWARYRLQKIDLALHQAWAGYRAQLLETVKHGLYASATLAQHPRPIDLVQSLVNLRTIFAQDTETLAGLPSVIALVCQLPMEKLTQPTEQPLVEGNTGRGLNAALLQVAGQSSPVLRALVEDSAYFSTEQALVTAIEAEGGTLAAVSVVQWLLLKLPRICSRAVIRCLTSAQQAVVQQQLDMMHSEWRILGDVVIAYLNGQEQALDRNALKLWRMTYIELQDQALAPQKQRVQEQIRTFFGQPNRVLSIQILAVLACLEPQENIQKYESDYLAYWIKARNKQYEEQHQAIVVHASANSLNNDETTFLRQVVLPNNLSWFEVLSLQQGMVCHPAFIAELSQQGCIGLSGVLLYCQQVPQMALLEGFSQQALVQKIQESTALVVGNSVNTQILTLQILQGAPAVVKNNIEMVNRLGALGTAFLAYGNGAALPPELLNHLEGYLNNTIALEGEIKKLLQEMVMAGKNGIVRLLKENPHYLKRLLGQPLFWTGLSFEEMRGLVQQYPAHLPQLGFYYGLAAQKEQLCVLSEEWESGYLAALNPMKDEMPVKIAKRVMPYTSRLMEQLSVPLIEDFHGVKAGNFNYWQDHLDLQFLFGFEASNRWQVWSVLYVTHRSFKKNSCAHYWNSKIRDTLRHACFQELNETYATEQQRLNDYKRVFLNVVKSAYGQLSVIEVVDASLLQAILLSALCRQETDLKFLRELLPQFMTPEERKNHPQYLAARDLLQNVFKGRRPHKDFVTDLRSFLRFHKQCAAPWAPLMDYPKQGREAFEQIPILELVEFLMFEASILYREAGTLMNAARTFIWGPPTAEVQWAIWKNAVLPNASLNEADSDDDLAPTI